LFCDIAFAIEDVPMAEAIRNTLLEISAGDRDAFAPMTTLIYNLPGHDSSPEQ